MSTNDPVIEVDSVTKSFGKTQALRGISFSVDRGEFFGVLGPNGAGKTTLLEVLVGLRRASLGSISILGESPWPRNRPLLTKIATQTQSAAFFPNLTAREHLETVVGLYGREPREAEALLERFGLTDKGATRVKHLSGGQKQRLELASAMCNDPDVIFLDEPTAALDPRARRDLWELLVELKMEGNRTVIYTTQQIEEAEKLCDRVMILQKGRVRTIGRPKDLIQSRSAFRLLIPLSALRSQDAAQLDGVDAVEIEGGRLALSTSNPASVFLALQGLVDPRDILTRSSTLEDAYLDSTMEAEDE